MKMNEEIRRVIVGFFRIIKNSNNLKVIKICLLLIITLLAGSPYKKDDWLDYYNPSQTKIVETLKIDETKEIKEKTKDMYTISKRGVQELVKVANPESWDIVNEKIGTGEKFLVVDIKTGNVFKVMRTNGENNMKVETINYVETKVMNLCKNPKDKTTKREVLVLTEDKDVFIASMDFKASDRGYNDIVPVNDVVGDFEIYFSGSKTDRDELQDGVHNKNIENVFKQRMNLQESNARINE